MVRAKIISPMQVVSFLFLSRIFSFLAYTPLSSQTGFGSAVLVGNILGMILIILSALPTYFLFRNTDHNDVIDMALLVSPKTQKFVAIIYWIICLIISINTISNFDYFITTTMYTKSSKFIFIFLIVLVCLYFNYFGLEPLARLSNIFLFIIIFALISISVLLIKKIDLTQIITPFYNGIKPIFVSAYQMVTQSIGLVIILLLKPNIKGNFKKSYIYYCIMIFAFIEILTFLTITILGDFAYIKPYPAYTLASIAETNAIKRMDSFHMFIWIFSSLIKLSLYIYLGTKCLAKVVRKKYKKYLVSINSIIVLLLSTFVSYKFIVFSNFNMFVRSGFILLIGVIIIPMFLAFKNRNKKRGDVS